MLALSVILGSRNTLSGTPSPPPPRPVLEPIPCSNPLRRWYSNFSDSSTSLRHVLCPAPHQTGCPYLPGNCNHPISDGLTPSRRYCNPSCPSVLAALDPDSHASLRYYMEWVAILLIRAHLFRYSVLIPMLGAAITYAQVGKLRISMFTSLLPAHPAQVFCAHPCSVTPFSPCSGTLCSPERAGCTMLILCSPCSGTLCSPC